MPSDSKRGKSKSPKQSSAPNGSSKTRQTGNTKQASEAGTTPDFAKPASNGSKQPTNGNGSKTKAAAGAKPSLAKQSQATKLQEKPTTQNQEVVALKRQLKAQQDFNVGIEAKIDKLTRNEAWKELFPRPESLEPLLTELFKDLRDVPVVLESGHVTDVFRKIDGENLLSREDKDLVWKCLALAREGFMRAEDPASGRYNSYQWMNWKHTRAEIDQVYEAAKLLRLSAKDTRDALLASIFSDSVKNRGNFIVHNVHGAEAAALVLSYFMKPANAQDIRTIERVVRAAKEHQIAPPEFMATVTAILLTKKNNLKGFNKTAEIKTLSGKEKVVHSIFLKIGNPFNENHLTEDLLQIKFTNEELELLDTIGVTHWCVPHPKDPESRIAAAVIAGDHSINYNNPEGFAKIALLRGPDTEAIFEDPTVHHSLDSAIASFADSFRVLQPEVQPLTIHGLRRTRTAVARVIAIMSELFNGVHVGPRCGPTRGEEKVAQSLKRAHEKHPELYAPEKYALSEDGQVYVDKAINRIGTIMQEWFDAHGDIPFSMSEAHVREPGPGKLPFWNSPLKYPVRDDNGDMKLASLSPSELKQFFFADKIREIAVELLRAEQWIFERQS